MRSPESPEDRLQRAKAAEMRRFDRRALAMELQMRICFGCQGAGKLLEGAWQPDADGARIVLCHICKGTGLHR
jgi:hypothetical protein